MTYETDSLAVHQMIQERKQVLPGSGTKIQECIDRIDSNATWRLRVIRWEANSIADGLARSARVNKFQWDKLDACARIIGDAQLLVLKSS